jgi:hypothetical protein
MFFVNWFKNANKNDDEIIIKRNEFDTLLTRLKNLEELMDNISQQAQLSEQSTSTPPPPPPLPLPSPIIRASSNMKNTTDLIRDDCESSNDVIKIDTSRPREHYVVPFQNELEIRLRMIRKRMGNSHGWNEWNEMPLDNEEDLSNLERSVIEKSIIISKDKKDNSKNTLTNANVIIYDDYSFKNF